jgi:glyoxylase-like metal-dependent hydrolase (beta-lactamase superfamily II)
MDHMGNLLTLKTKFPHLEVFAHREEIPYIDGTLTHLKIQDVVSGKVILTQDKQAWFDNLKSIFPTLVCPVDLALEDKDVLDIAGGLEVIATPGHTLGHICLYHRPNKTLIAGDALNLSEGHLSGPNPFFTHDVAQAFTSIQKLAKVDLSQIILYHGGLIEGQHLDQQIKTIPVPLKEVHHG